MGFPLIVCSDSTCPLTGGTAWQVRALAKASRHADQTRRLLAVAEIYDGRSRTEAARVGGVGLQTLRDWVLAFNVRGPGGLLRGKAPGNPAILKDAHRQVQAEMLENGPDPAVHGIVRWRLVDLIQWLFETYRLSISKQTLSRELQDMGYAKLSARPRHHAQDVEALEAFKKTSPPVRYPIMGAWVLITGNLYYVAARNIERWRNFPDLPWAAWS